MYCSRDKIGKPLARDLRPVTISYKGLSRTFDMPGWYAEGVEDGIHSGEDMKVSDRELNRLKAEAEHLLTPDEVRAIRRKLRLSQRDAGLVIGGGPRAFQKYESGEVLVSRGIASALRLLERHPEEIATLRSLIPDAATSSA
ncbi:type II toxin-antitoxin system MqsA family antitoxin [Stappia sp. WLB 29]|uniref:type II toxin-antitoxin system MqsA family antitoxin n=1 Tax=Stappia sp. WLB 29 TaxID=2925220 RepID=UPI0024BDB7EE|nr:type II toxin-antitoxin system MqsA family antitoxin [Stappia sp. WLB 29]